MGWAPGTRARGGAGLGPQVWGPVQLKSKQNTGPALLWPPVNGAGMPAPCALWLALTQGWGRLTLAEPQAARAWKGRADGPEAGRVAVSSSPAALAQPSPTGTDDPPSWGGHHEQVSLDGSLVKQVQSQPLCTPSGLSWAIKHFKVTQHPATGPECSLLSPRHRRLGKSLGSRPCPLLACWPEGPCVLLQDHSASWLPPELSLSQEPQVALQRTHPQATPLPCLPPHEAPWDQARSLTRPGPSGLLPPPPTAVCLGASARVHGLLWPHFGAVSLADHPDRLL